jgi:hypothetical protein
VTIDDPLLRRMARDAAIYSLTRPVAVVMWVALAGALVLGVLNLADRTANGQEASPLIAWTPAVVVVLAVYAIVLSVSSARRAVRAAMPVDAVVWVSIDDDQLRMGSDRRRSDIPYTTFQHVRVGRDAVLLKLRGSAVATAIPRVLLSDEDVATLRSRIA